MNKSTITSTITSNPDISNEKSSAAKIYSFLSQSESIRSSICKLFLFKPPKPKGYKFEKTSFFNGEIQYKFFVQGSNKGIYKSPVLPERIELFTYCLKLKRGENSELNTIPAIYLKNKENEDKFLVIYSHGNASDLGDVFDFAKIIAKIYKVNVLAYDYRGYGISKGYTCEKSTYDDLEYALSFAQEKLHYELSHIILWGFSLGTGPTVEIAARYQNLGGVILQSPLASVLVWLDKKANWDYQYSSTDIYCNINKIENIKAKIFIIHGKRDQTIDFRHSNLLYEKYVNFSKDNNQIWLVLAEGVGHNDIQYLIEDEGGIFYKRIMKFIELVKYPLLLKETRLLKDHKAQALKEENKTAFLEKEKNSLRISFQLLQVNECIIPNQIPKKCNLMWQSTGSTLNEDEIKNEENQLLLDNGENIFKKIKSHDLNGSEPSIKYSENSLNIGLIETDQETDNKNSWIMQGFAHKNSNQNNLEEEIAIKYNEFILKDNHF